MNTKLIDNYYKIHKVNIAKACEVMDDFFAPDCEYRSAFTLESCWDVIASLGTFFPGAWKKSKIKLIPTENENIIVSKWEDEGMLDGSLSGSQDRIVRYTGTTIFTFKNGMISECEDFINESQLLEYLSPENVIPTLFLSEEDSLRKLENIILKHCKLTTKQILYTSLWVSGLGAKDIASLLDYSVSARTVEGHIRTIYNHLGNCHSRGDLLEYLSARGLWGYFKRYCDMLLYARSKSRS